MKKTIVVIITSVCAIVNAQDGDIIITSTTTPRVFNNYTYKNESLKKYNITIWNTSNSALPDNYLSNVTVDSSNQLWLISNVELCYLNGNNVVTPPENTTVPKKQAKYFEMGIDKDNNIWLDGLGDNLFSYGNGNWAKWTPETTKSEGAYDINYNAKTGETFFCSDAGLSIKKGNTWTKINKEVLKELPSNRVCFAQRDSKNRLWIGTYSGAVMIDENNKATSFETTDTILKGLTITSMAEDENGNLYFGLFEFNLKKHPGERNKKEGIGIYSKEGTWKQLITENSGLPCNQNNNIAYSKKEKVLWISSETCGLTRYDIKNDKWENYHSENSTIASKILGLDIDKKGILYLATESGLVKIEKK